MKRRIILAVILMTVFSCAALCPAEDQIPVNMPDSIHTPEDLSQWLSSNFRYVMEIPDHWQNAGETLNLRTGDCEDFAVLSKALLDRIGIASEIVIVEFRGLQVTHAMCAWQDAHCVNLMSNGRLRKVEAGSIKNAIKKIYPDCKSIRFIQDIP